MSPPLKLVRTHKLDPDFLFLNKMLDQELSIKNGDQQFFFSQFNQPADVGSVVLAYRDHVPMACGALKQHNAGQTVEIKRMFVEASERRTGIARQVLSELHNWAKELGYVYAVLETSIHFRDAVQLYRSSGYQPIPKYEPYLDSESSICMRITL